MGSLRARTVRQARASGKRLVTGHRHGGEAVYSALMLSPRLSRAPHVTLSALLFCLAACAQTSPIDSTGSAGKGGAGASQGGGGEGGIAGQGGATMTPQGGAAGA